MERFAICMLAAAGMAAPALAGPGDLRWRFVVEHPYAYAASGTPAIGADGTIYWMGYGLRAISPEGQELWSDPDSGSTVIALGPDGTLYTGGWVNIGTPDEPFWEPTLRALRPDGSLVWDFFFPSNWGSFTAGPFLGPDGHLYGVTRGPGYRQPGPAFSMTTGGSLRWELDGFFGAPGRLNGLVGADGRFYIAGERTPFDEGMFGSDSGLAVLDLEGNALWYRLYGHGTYTTRTPAATAPGGHVAIPMGEQVEVRSRDGDLLWTHVPPWSPTGVNNVLTGPDGAIYVMYGNRSMQKLDPDGNVLWTCDGSTPTGFATVPTLSPDGSLIAYATTGCLDLPDTACPGSVAAIRTGTGEVAWSVEMPRVSGGPLESNISPVFSHDGGTVYIEANARVSGHAYLFAYETGPGACGADFDGSGTLTLSDFVAFRNAYAAGDLAADFDNDSGLTLSDFVAFRNAYAAGCP